MSGPKPHEIAEAREFLKLLIAYPGGGMQNRECYKTLLAATEPPTNDKLAGLMADYCVDEIKIDTDRASVAESYKRDMDSSNEHSYGRMARYLANRLFGGVKP